MRKPMSPFARRTIATFAATAVLAGVMSSAGAAPPPEDSRTHARKQGAGQLGVRVTSPPELVGFHPGLQWGATGKVDFQEGALVYAGTGCTPANYALIASQIRGNIALVDDRVSESNPNDQCPRYTFVQKVRSAQEAGAIGFVQIPREGIEPNGNATAVAADIPALEVERTAAILAVRDAAVAGTNVQATLTPPPGLEAMSNVPCVDGKAGPFACKGIDLLSFVPQDEFNGAGVSDIWGWTDPQNGDEYVFFGKTNGTAFFRVTNPTKPVYLGELPNKAVNQQIWHDMKVFKDHAFIVSESEPHGMTVFDLTRLRGVTEPQLWDQDAFYPLYSAAHNIAINEETGFAYVVGGNAGIVVPDQCLSGLHIIDINDPKKPVFAGCFQRDGGPGTAARTVGDPATSVSPAAYIHDTQCVIYRGPDERYQGREICFNSSENKVVIVDVTNKALPQTIGMTNYADVFYTHQGWLTEDQSYFLANDELDETGTGSNTRTLVFDVRDLENPKLHFQHFHEVKSIDHNLYTHQGLVYESNYTSGLRVLDTAPIDDPVNPRLDPVGFFDVFPAHTDATFDGTWSNYPYFESGTIAVSSIGEGLFLLRLQKKALPNKDLTMKAKKRTQGGVRKARLSWSGASSRTVDVFRKGRRIATVANDGAYTDRIGKRRGGAVYTYRICETGTSNCSNVVKMRFRKPRDR